MTQGPGRSRPRILVVAEETDWHIRRLAKAASAHALDMVACPLRDCAFAIGAGGSGIAIPGFAGALPDAVLVRTVGNGSFEQVTLRLGLLHALASAGVPVANEARAIERCVDKSMTSFLLQRAGLPTPPTIAAEAATTAASFRAHVRGDVVLKPLFGSQGRGLLRLSPDAPLPDAESVAGVWYLQRFIGRETAWRDYRVFVVGGVPVAAMIRHGTSWVTNVHRGARCEATAASGRLGELAAAAAVAVGADYAGVDLMEDEAGALQVLEVNSMPAWKGLQGVAEIDIADRLIAHVARRIA